MSGQPPKKPTGKGKMVAEPSKKIGSTSSSSSSQQERARSSASQPPPSRGQGTLGSNTRESSTDRGRQPLTRFERLHGETTSTTAQAARGGMPITMDYNMTGFDMGLAGGNRPPTLGYEARPEPETRLTRSREQSKARSEFDEMMSAFPGLSTRPSTPIPRDSIDSTLTVKAAGSRESSLSRLNVLRQDSPASERPSSPHASSAGLGPKIRVADRSERHVWVIMQWIDNNVFWKPSQVEAGFLDNPAFTDHELRRAMEYAIEKALKAVRGFQRICNSVHYQAPGIISLRTFADEKHGDTDPENVYSLEFLADEDDFENMPVDTKFKRSLAVLCKIRKEAERTGAELKQKASKTIERRRELKAWIKNERRLNSRPYATPVYLADPRFTPDDLKEVAVWTANRRFRLLAWYIDLRDPIRRLYTDEELAKEGIRLLTDDELEYFEVPIGKDMVDLAKVTDDVIRSIVFAPVEEPTYHKTKDDIEQEAREHKKVKNAREAREQHERMLRTRKRKEHGNFRWSLALVAKSAKQIEIAFRKLQDWVNAKDEDDDDDDDDEFEPVGDLVANFSPSDSAESDEDSTRQAKKPPPTKATNPKAQIPTIQVSHH